MVTSFSSACLFSQLSDESEEEVQPKIHYIRRMTEHYKHTILETCLGIDDPYVKKPRWRRKWNAISKMIKNGLAEGMVTRKLCVEVLDLVLTSFQTSFFSAPTVSKVQITDMLLLSTSFFSYPLPRSHRQGGFEKKMFPSTSYSFLFQIKAAAHIDISFCKSVCVWVPLRCCSRFKQKMTLPVYQWFLFDPSMFLCTSRMPCQKSPCSLFVCVWKRLITSKCRTSLTQLISSTVPSSVSECLSNVWGSLW